MQVAIAEARKGLGEGGIPIGSALAREGELSRLVTINACKTSDPVTHAEIDCLRARGPDRKFRGTVLYSTLMPCYLCSGAVVQFGIRK